MYRDTITVFNHYQSKTADIWYPTVIHGVDLNVDRAAIIAKYGAESKDNAILHVKLHNVNGTKYIGKKPYLLPKEWSAQPNDALPGTITFTGGQTFDFFIAGEWSDNTPIDDAEYTNGFYDYLNKRHDNVFAVTSVAEYSLIPHLEIMAK